MEPGKHYEMLWDCGFCGTKGLLGLTHRCCPGCGAAQDPTRRYFPPEGEEVAVEDHPWQGADRRCPACAAPNAARSQHCTTCGAPLDGAAEVALRGTQVAGAQGFEADDAARARSEVAAARAAREAAIAQAPVPAPARSSRWLWLVLVTAVLTLGCGGLLWAFFAEQPLDVEVTGRSWERTVDIERLTTVRDEAWRGEVPMDARGSTCHRAQRGTRQVPDGQTCTTARVDAGDGTFRAEQRCTPRTRSEPVYDERCSFDVDRWRSANVLRSSGTTEPPAWPAVALGRPGTCVGCEREGPRAEVYTVVVRDPEGTEHTCTLPAARWAELEVGTHVEASVGRFTGWFRCGDLEAPSR